MDYSTNNPESPTNNPKPSEDAASEPSTPDPRTVQIYNPDSGLAAPTRTQKNHPVQNIIGDPNSGVLTRGKKRDYSELVGYVCYTSKNRTKEYKGSSNR
nr:uncharacterized protein LOC109153996 [Ipomoea batatas]